MTSRNPHTISCLPTKTSQTAHLIADRVSTVLHRLISCLCIHLRFLLPDLASPGSASTMGQIFSHSSHDNDSSSLKRSPSNSASSALLKQTISQNMRLSKNKVSSLLKANHMHHSIVHRNHFYNTLPHVSFPIHSPCHSSLILSLVFRHLPLDLV